MVVLAGCGWGLGGGGCGCGFVGSGRDETVRRFSVSERESERKRERVCVGERKRAKHEQGKKKTGGKFRLSGEM